MLLHHDRRDMIIGLSLLFFCALMLYAVIPAEVPVRGDIRRFGLSPRFFPKFSVACIMIFSAALALHSTFFRARHSSRKSEQRKVLQEDQGSLFNVGAAMGLMVGFIILMRVLGAMTAIPIFLIAFMRFAGMKSWPKILALACSTVVVIYLFFERLLYVILPEGFLF